MRVVHQVYNAEQVVVHLSPSQPVVNMGTLDAWARNIQTAVNDTAMNQREHDLLLHELKKQHEAMSLILKSANDFMEYVSAAYPHVMADYLATRAASQRLTT